MLGEIPGIQEKCSERVFIANQIQFDVPMDYAPPQNSFFLLQKTIIRKFVKSVGSELGTFSFRSGSARECV